MASPLQSSLHLSRQASASPGLSSVASTPSEEVRRILAARAVDFSPVLYERAIGPVQASPYTSDPDFTADIDLETQNMLLVLIFKTNQDMQAFLTASNNVFGENGIKTKVTFSPQFSMNESVSSLEFTCSLHPARSSAEVMVNEIVVAFPAIIDDLNDTIKKALELAKKKISS